MSASGEERGHRMRGSATILQRRMARVRVSANTERGRLAVLGLLALIIAVGTSVIFLGAASAAPVTLVDDGGPDDLAGQKDLNFLTVDPGFPARPAPTCSGDGTTPRRRVRTHATGVPSSTATATGSRTTRSASPLRPAGMVVETLWTCGDGASDRCTQDREIVPERDSRRADDFDPLEFGPVPRSRRISEPSESERLRRQPGMQQRRHRRRTRRSVSATSAGAGLSC